MLHTREEVARLSTVLAYPPYTPIIRLRSVLHCSWCSAVFHWLCRHCQPFLCENLSEHGDTLDTGGHRAELETCQHPGYLWSATERGPGTINWDFTRSCPETQFLSLLVITQIQIYIDDHFIAAVHNHVQISTFWHFNNINNSSPNCHRVRDILSGT